MKYSYVITEGYEKSKVFIDVILKDKLSGIIPEGGAVTTVDTLPDTGESGKIYYNTEDCKYYVYGEGGFSKLGETGSSPVVSGDDLPVLHNDPDHLIIPNTYRLSAGVYYDLGTPTNIAPISRPEEYTITLYFPERAADPDSAYCYFGRFTAPADDIGITLKNGVHFPDEHPDIESGHTYEFSVLYDTFLITDITYTPNNG